MEELENFMGHIGAGTKWLNAPKSIHEKKKQKKNSESKILSQRNSVIFSQSK